MVEELEGELSESRINKGQLQKAAFIRSHRIKHTPDSEVCSIKLKNVLIKEEDQEDGYEVCDGESDEKKKKKKKITRICHVCNKGFSSGKALGGHMRIHGHLYKKRQKDAAFDEQEEEEEEGDDDEYCYDIFRGDMVEKKKKMVVPVCSICGKDFQSMKSLYGHMRSHPRNWKGIHPPAENPVVDLKKALKCWSVTAKRGRKVSSAAGDQTSGLSEDTEEEQLRGAAHELMMLARGEYDEELDSLSRRRRNSLSYKVVAEHEDRVNLDFAMRKSSPPPSSAFSVGNTGRVMTKNVPGKAKATPENQESAAFGGAANSSSSGGEESKELISRYREPTTYNNRANEKTRKKKKMRLIKLKDLDSVHHNAAVNQGNRNAAVAEEKYNKCGKWFPSHEALGGHKSHHQILDFDLNQVPEEENDDDDDHHHYGYVSISLL